MMKIFLLACLLLTGFFTNAQNLPADTIVTTQPVIEKASTVPTQGTTPRPGMNMYGQLLNDDPVYNPKAPWYKPAIRVFTTNVFNWATARYVYKQDWAVITPKIWKENFKKGPEWDNDGFGVNFIGHPHTGNGYFNVARANGYSYWGSLTFALQGSLTWEFLGENTRASYNDLINTLISGAFFGEILYRLSSNVLDDRATGRERVFREILAAIINPPRALNRLTQGKMRRVTNKEVYQKEPLNMTFNGGAHRININNNEFASGATNAILNIQLDYGNPFEKRARKPFDVFRFRAELSYGADRKLLENINGYGILAGKTTQTGRFLVGAFQHFDYWNNNVFEVGTLGFGGGIISRKPVAKHSNIYSTIHLAIVPLAGNNTQFGPDTSSFRRYNFGGGFQGKMEETFNLNNWASIGFQGFYYWIHTYSGIKGNSLVGIFKPSLNIKLFKNVSVGFEHLIYQNDLFLKGEKNLHITRTEQKLYLQLFLEDGKPRGKYH